MKNTEFIRHKMLQVEWSLRWLNKLISHLLWLVVTSRMQNTRENTPYQPSTKQTTTHPQIHRQIHRQTQTQTDRHRQTDRHARTHARTHARKHARTRARTHARTHTHTHSHTIWGQRTDWAKSGHCRSVSPRASGSSSWLVYRLSVPKAQCLIRVEGKFSIICHAGSWPR